MIDCMNSIFFLAYFLNYNILHGHTIRKPWFDYGFKKIN